MTIEGLPFHGVFRGPLAGHTRISLPHWACAMERARRIEQ